MALNLHMAISNTVYYVYLYYNYTYMIILVFFNMSVPHRRNAQYFLRLSFSQSFDQI